MNPKKILRAATAADLQILRRLSHPIISFLEAGVAAVKQAAPGQRPQKPAVPECTNLHVLEAVYLLTITNEAATELMDRGYHHFSQAAVRELDARFKPKKFCKLIAPTWENFASAFLSESKGKA